MGARSLLWPWLVFLWGVVFGALNLWWSVGGELLLDRLAVRIQAQAAEGDTALLVLNTVGGLGKIGIGLLALGTVSRWGRRIPRGVSLAVLYAGGVLLVLYGGANWTQMLLVELGYVDVPVSVGAAQVRWYLFLWEPVWMVGGVAMVLTAEGVRRRA
jgi:hypothetical protein